MSRIPETRLSLIARVRDPHDRQAWSEFTEIYEPMIYRVARRKGLQDADAWEVTQEVLAAVAQAVDEWEPTAGGGSFRAWLFQIARNRAINLLIRQQHHPRASGDSAMRQQLQAQTTSDDKLFDEEYERQVFRWAAGQIRDQFTEQTWQAFWSTAVDGQSVKVAATELGMSIGAVYIARSRVMAGLKKQVERHEHEDDSG